MCAKQKYTMLFNAPLACAAAAKHAVILVYDCWLKKLMVNTRRLVTAAAGCVSQPAA